MQSRVNERKERKTTMKKLFKKSRLSVLLGLLLAVSLLAGCGGSVDTDAGTEMDSEETTSEGTVSEEESGDDTHYPVTISTYNYEKESVDVTFDKCPARVICTNQTQTEMMLYFGLDEYIAGTAYLDGSIRPDLADAYDALAEAGKELTVTGYPDKEIVISLEPDFIFGWRSAFADDALGDVSEWHDRGIATMIVRCSNNTADDRSINSVLADIADLGAIFDIEDVTDAYISDARGMLEEIDEYVSDIGDKQNVLFLEADGDGIWYAWSTESLTGSLVESAGAVNLAGEVGGDLSVEDIIAYNPDAIVIDYMKGESEEEEEAAAAAVATLTGESSLAEVTAVADGRIMAVNLTDVYGGGIRIIPSLYSIYEFLYGEE